jgi:hypothetical protein
MRFGSAVRQWWGGWRRRSTPLVVSGVLHAGLLAGLAAHRVSPISLPSARPAGDDAGVALAVPVRITGTMYGPTIAPTPTPPFKAALEAAPKPRESLAAGRHPGRRSRPRGLSGLDGRAAAPVDGSAAISTPLAAAPIDEPQSPEPAPIDVRPPAPEAAPVTAVVQMPTTVARGLRVFDTFPRLPRELSRAGARYPVDLEICVDKRGAVANVHVESGGPEQLNDVLVPAVRTWRYRPYTVGGMSRPFCHSLRIVYSTT